MSESRRAGDPALPHADARVAPLRPADLAWLLLPPFVALAAPAILLLAPSAGRVLFPDPGYHWWFPAGVRKAGVQAGYLMFACATAAYVAVIVRASRMRLYLDPRIRRALVGSVQALAVGFVVVCWLAQRPIVVLGTSDSYFTPATLVVAAAIAAVMLALAGGRGRASRILVGLRSRGDARTVAWICFGAAAIATAVWLLPAISTDGRPGVESYYLDAYFFDETAAVLDGRSPLVNMVAYGNLWPYLVALPLDAFHGAFAAYTALMATIAGVSLLAVYGVLRRLVRPLAALALYLPVLATSFFLESSIGIDRYDPGTYFGMFPLRYAGPYLLMYLTARHLGGAAASRRSARLLLAVAGLVVLNNVDFGGSALVATVVALAIRRGARDARALGRLALDAALGLAAAFALVAVLTLARAGSLPHLALLGRYGRVFVDGGFGNLALPRLGWHLAISATFVAAAALAAVRVAGRERDVLLTGMLAWAAIFGLGASVYFYAYRSHPDVLVSLFSIWSLTLALLLIAVFRTAPGRRRWPTVPAFAVAFGFALAVCSLAQAPAPWRELRRIASSASSASSDSLQLIASGSFREAAVARRVAEQTHPGERVIVFSPVGHRVAWDARVTNVSPYTGLEQMPAIEQLDETVALLRREGGSRIFVAQAPPPGLDQELRRLGCRVVHRWRVAAWMEQTVAEYQAS